MAGERTVAQIIAEAWADPEFKRRLLATPEDVLRERGLDVPPGVRVVMLENTVETRHVVLPHRPPEWDEGESVQPLIAGGSVPFHMFGARRAGGRKRGGGRKGGGRKGGGRKGGGRKRPK